MVVGQMYLYLSPWKNKIYSAKMRLLIHIIFTFISSRQQFFVQLEDELQSLQHSLRWLQEKGSQLAQRDSELAVEALRDVALVNTAWETVKTLITNG